MPIKLRKEGCRKRQRRLLRLLEKRGADGALITDWRDVYYFSGVISEMPYPRAFVLTPDGDALLILEKEYPEAAGGRQLVYPLQTMATLNFMPHSQVAKMAKDAASRSKRLAVQWESLPAITADLVTGVSGAELIGIDDDLLRLQAVKDEDEMAVLRRANELNDIGYTAVRVAIEEGVSEAEVLAAGKAAVVSAAGCDCFYSGDFACAVPGGFATERVCRAGELYIVDAWVNYQGYWSDNCRTFPVTTITKAQREAWKVTEKTVFQAEEMVRPGVSCREVFEAMKKMQDKIKPQALFHHGGHGVGLRNHGYPRINPHFDDVFEEGNVITIEPGVYGKDLQSGIRLEFNYLVSAKGVERLNKFPISMPTHLGRG